MENLAIAKKEIEELRRDAEERSRKSTEIEHALEVRKKKNDTSEKQSKESDKLPSLQNCLAKTRKDASNSKERAEETRHKRKLTTTLRRITKLKHRRNKPLGKVEKGESKRNKIKSEQSQNTSHLTKRGKFTIIDSANITEIPTHGNETWSSHEMPSKCPPRNSVKHSAGAVKAKINEKQLNQSSQLPKDDTDSIHHALVRKNTGKHEESENKDQKEITSIWDQMLVEKMLSQASSKAVEVQNAGESSKHDEFSTIEHNEALEKSMRIKTSNVDSMVQNKKSTSNNFEMKRNITAFRAYIETILEGYIESEKSLKMSLKVLNARLAIAEDTANSVKLQADIDTEKTKILEATIRSELSRVKMRLKSYRRLSCKTRRET